MNKTKRIEYTIYTLTLCIVLFIPVLTLIDRNVFSWNRLFLDWFKYLPFLIILLFSNYILLPKFLFRKRYVLFTVLLILIIIIVTYLSAVFGKNFHEWLFSQTEIPPHIDGPHRPGMHPPGMNNQPPPGMPPPPAMLQKPFTTVLFNNSIIALLVVGLNAAVKTFSMWVEDERSRRELEKQFLKSELAFLKHQISPHFFMNTLNNIHALVDINSEDAKNAIIKLSKLMRYFLYESKDGFSTLKKEIEFITSYIELMRLRFEEEVKIDFNYPEDMQDIEVPAFLYLTFIENAFKHGINQKVVTCISFSFAIEGQQLVFKTENSLSDPELIPNLESSGIGLNNVKKRLDLLYVNNYQLIINETNNNFELELKIPIK